MNDLGKNTNLIAKFLTLNIGENHKEEMRNFFKLHFERAYGFYSRNERYFNNLANDARRAEKEQ